MLLMQSLSSEAGAATIVFGVEVVVVKISDDGVVGVRLEEFSKGQTNVVASETKRIRKYNT